MKKTTVELKFTPKEYEIIKKVSKEFVAFTNEMFACYEAGTIKKPKKKDLEVESFLLEVFTCMAESPPLTFEVLRESGTFDSFLYFILLRMSLFEQNKKEIAVMANKIESYLKATSKGYKGFIQELEETPKRNATKRKVAKKKTVTKKK